MVLKLILTGDPAVGKTALKNVYLGNPFRSNYIMSLGAEFSLKTMTLPPSGSYEGGPAKFQIFDLAGQPSFERVRSLYYKGIHGVIIIYDLAREETLESTTQWLVRVQEQNTEPFAVVLVGNKLDLRPTVDNCLGTQAGRDQAGQLVKTTGLDVSFIETSALENTHVKECFELAGLNSVVTALEGDL